MDRKREVAIHEAGHCCAALLLGRAYGCAIFGEGVESSGLAGTGDLSKPADAADYIPARLGPCYVGQSLAELLDDSTVTAAGCAAVSLASGAHLAPRAPKLRVAGCDGASLRAACEAAFEQTDYHVLEAWHDLAATRARRLLGPVFHRVLAVAAALESRGRLTATEVAEIYHAPPDGTD
jgi:hypothetical protein